MAIQHAVETQKCPFVEFFTVPEWKSKELAALSAHPITSLAIWGVGKDHDWVFFINTPSGLFLSTTQAVIDSDCLSCFF